MLNLIYQHCVSFVMIINSSHIKTIMTFFFQNIHELKTTYMNCYLYTQLYQIQHHHNWEYTFPYYYTTENRIIRVLWENLMSSSYPQFSKTPSCLKTWHDMLPYLMATVVESPKSTKLLRFVQKHKKTSEET